MFSYPHVFLDEYWAAFVFSAKKPPKKQNKQTNKIQSNEASALKASSDLPGQRPHPKSFLNHFEYTQFHQTAFTIVQIFPTQAYHSCQVLRHQDKFVFEVNVRYD